MQKLPTGIKMYYYKSDSTRFGGDKMGTYETDRELLSEMHKSLQVQTIDPELSILECNMNTTLIGAVHPHQNLDELSRIFHRH